MAAISKKIVNPNQYVINVAISGDSANFIFKRVPSDCASSVPVICGRNEFR